MYNAILLFLIFLCLFVIIFIIIKKLPILAGLDVRNMPAEKEARFREQIVSNKLKRNIFKWTHFLVKFFIFLGEKIGQVFEKVYNYLLEYKQQNQGGMILTGSEKIKKQEKLIEEAQKLSQNGNFLEAEKKLIEVIGIDEKNLEAFKMLGYLYLEHKNYQNAQQTLKHALKLIRETEDKDFNQADIAKLYFDLALINKMIENFDSAINNIEKALNIEENNPRYLDTALDISIMRKDKIAAFDFYERLTDVNPENQKLIEWQKKIDQI